MFPCPRCTSEKRVKDGRVNQRQRYRCKECRYKYTVEDRRPQAERRKRAALTLYLEGLGFRSIARLLQVSHVAVYKWIRGFGSQVQQIRSEEKPRVVELDELHTYIGSKKKSAGYGLLWLESRNESWVSSWEAEPQ